MERKISKREKLLHSCSFVVQKSESKTNGLGRQKGKWLKKERGELRGEREWLVSD